MTVGIKFDAKTLKIDERIANLLQGQQTVLGIIWRRNIVIVRRRKILLIHHKTFLCCVTKIKLKTQPMREIAGIATNTIPMGLLVY